jgi:hypothetical protein
MTMVAGRKSAFFRQLIHRFERMPTIQLLQIRSTAIHARIATKIAVATGSLYGVKGISYLHPMRVEAIALSEEGLLMKSVSKLALIFALGTFAAAPAVYAAKDEAKKEKKSKEKAPAPKKMAFSKEFIKAYSPAVDLLKKKDNAGAKVLWPAIKATILNEDDRYEAGIFAQTVGRDTADVALQNEGLELMIASTSTPVDQRKVAMTSRGQIAYNAKDYVTAEKFLKMGYDAGFRGNNVEILLANSFVLRKRHGEALPWLQAAIDNTRAAGGVPEKQWFAQANNYAGILKDSAKMSHWGKELIKADPRSETYHDALFQFVYNNDLDSHESLDLLRLARKTGSIIRENEYKQYMEYVDPRRYPAEALAVLEEGFAKGTISRTNLFFVEQVGVATPRAAELKLGWDADEKAALANPKGFAALLFGESQLAFGEYARAQKLFEAALAKGGVADREGKDQSDRARMRLGIAKVMQGNFAGAKSDFSAVTGVNRKAIAEYWLIYLGQQGA